MAGVVAMAAAVSGTTVMHAAPALVFLGSVGLGMIANGALRLPGWARRRERQMEALAVDVARPSTAFPPAPSNT